jgi:hypothetical protein
MDDYAKIDNNLAGSQRDIGESSNIAQIAQTYTCNFPDQKYIDYVCILSVLAQVAIDSAKRRFDIDLTEEIRRIKNDMDIKKNMYPNFWRLIRPDIRLDKVNVGLHCPMNYLYDLELSKFRHKTTTLPISYFFKKFELEKNRKTCRRVEDLISAFSLQLEKSRGDDEESYLLLRSDFDDLIRSIQTTYISKNYLGLMSWLLDRAFTISPEIKRNKKEIRSKLRMNKSVLVKALYQTNSANLLKCFSKNC